MSDSLLSKIAGHNRPEIKDDVTLALRAITEKRAATIAYMLDEAAQLGLDEQYARRAIAHYGADNGRRMAASMQDADSLVEFAKVFTDGLEAKVYEMETISAEPDRFIVRFHYCPYVNKWLTQNRAAAEIHQLCDICLEGDNAITQGFRGIQFAPVKTLARGDACCEMHYFREGQ